jgi:N-acetylneuraminic acid mutarotase
LELPWQPEKRVSRVHAVKLVSHGLALALAVISCGADGPVTPTATPNRASLSARVIDDVELAVPGVALTAEVGTLTRNGVTNADGFVRFDSLPSGNGVLRLTLPSLYRAETLTREVTLTSGSTANATFQLMLRAGALVVQVNDSLGGVVSDAVIEAAPATGTAQTATTAANGVATFTRLAHGTYNVRISSGVSGAPAAARSIQVAEGENARTDFIVPSAPPGSWRIGSPLRTPRASLAAVSDNSGIYVLGGGTLDVDRFDGTSWQKETELPEILNAAAAALVNGEIFVIGGFLGSGNIPTDRVRIYNIASKQWREGERMPTARGGIQTAVLNNQIYVIGGGNQFQTLAANEVYDPQSNAWNTLAPLPRQRGNPALAAFNGRVYAIGGASGGATFSDVDIFDPATNSWSSGPAISPSRVAARAVVYRGSLFVFGGEASSGPALKNVSRLNTTNMTWEAMTRMPTGRSYAGSALFNDAVFIIGGSTLAPTTHASGGTTSVESFLQR